MEAVGVDVTVAPRLTVTALGFVLGGILLGTISGLTPGLHANNFALLLAGIAPMIPGPPLLVGAAMLAAGVVHTFLDAVPALALGVPDADMALAALPGHRLVIAGQGHEALRLSALGSGIAVLLAIPLAVPITYAMMRWYPVLRHHMPIVLGSLVVVMLLTESNSVARLGGLSSFLASSALGFLVLDMTPEAPLDGGGVLAPLFAGLFGAPVLIDAMGGGGVPRQAGPEITIPRRAVVGPAVAGAGAGAIVGYLPGVSSAIAAVVALLALPGKYGDRGFIIATSGVNTANTIFALFALVALGAPRTGVLVAVNQADVPLNLPFLLAAVAIASAAGFVLVLLVGDWYLETIGRVDYVVVCGVVLGALVVLSFLFAGFVGIGVFVVSTVLGFLPVRTGAKRVHLMGVLMGPIMVWTWSY